MSFFSGTDKKLEELRYGLHGEIPDGMLFRVSSIDTNTQSAFSLQESFVRDLLNSLEPHVEEACIRFRLIACVLISSPE